MRLGDVRSAPGSGTWAGWAEGVLWKTRNPEPGKPSRYGNNLRTLPREQGDRGGGGDGGRGISAVGGRGRRGC